VRLNACISRTFVNSPPPVLQCVAVCCSVLQCVAVCCSVLQCECSHVSVACSLILPTLRCIVMLCVAVCCSVCCSVLQCVAVCCSMFKFTHVYLSHFCQSFRLTTAYLLLLFFTNLSTHSVNCNALQRVAVRCSVCCSVL